MCSRGLAVVRLDGEADIGSYWDRNVWIVHSVGPG
jgi:hypothetical protein